MKFRVICAWNFSHLQYWMVPSSATSYSSPASICDGKH